ncbi:hypothetical protein [Streptomyces sp. NBC_00582]|uniref:hypothetical protein n=1 Tax=Streptomyces sp. NBC_00582 TaxID=2975783 RepID=UPI002E80E409|nr:hypothetical protein [Streptomyces sp. NBC_00582]WUB63852.1 hypothetical protein OG852_27400 [Streptomyces sp. NBC_00582]
MNLRELALEEATLKALADHVTDRLKAVRGELQQGLDAAEQESGTRQIVATLPDEKRTPVATLSLNDPKPEAKVIDPDAFKAWVMATFPGEIERRFVAEVRPAFVDKVLGEMTAAGVARVVNTETGELHDDVPGVAVKATRARGHSLRFKPAGKEAIATAWQSGALPLPGVSAPAAIEAPKYSPAQLKELEESSRRLAALEAAGVDNWSGYDHAMEILRGEA